MGLYSAAAKNAMLDALTPTIDLMKLHTGDPGAAGANLEVSGGSYASQDPAFNAASGGVAQLSSNVVFTGLPITTVGWVTFWDGAVFLGGHDVTDEVYASAGGEYTVLAASTSLTITDV